MTEINPYLKIFFGLVFVLLGLGYVYKPEIIERINRLIKETFLNDSYIALHRKNWGFLLLLVGGLLIYMGVTRVLTGG
ncbi:MAG: hypothetical protein COX65_02835 [Elusimicrobia bacterium CG_4_10_14_0_2_um_filter_56_8]|nr:MAG: hypothetical protein AUJ51_06850 [Elusimicrobia bacterium CG1_02_56_21]PJA16280.1 MAG: hypothetical protein COX65_02835 [Elusimicrobia bacterium CG_4_10_14_0_2_um_filter_56_8]